MRIVSLLPSATEIVYALGLEDDLAAVSCDCDFPAAAMSKPIVSRSRLDRHDDSPAAIDDAVREGLSQWATIYELDRDLIRDVRPELILAQDLCRVCALPSGHVTEALEDLGTDAEVVSLDPHTLDEVFDGIVEVARAARIAGRGEDVAIELRRRAQAVAARAGGATAVATLALEWTDPPFTGGHWIPEMVRIAGGRDVLGVERAPSRTTSWSEIEAAAPEVVVVMPCGFGLDAAIDQAHDVMRSPHVTESSLAAAQWWAVDGSSYFSRPGPRLVDGLEILARVLHPEVFGAPSPAQAVRVR